MRCRSVTFAWPWDGSGGGCLSAVTRKPVSPGLRWSAEWLAGSRKLTFVILIPGSALALLPKARAGCSNAARPDPWRGLWVTMIPTPTSLRYVQGLRLFKVQGSMVQWFKDRVGSEGSFHVSGILETSN